jgi:hypothetical protein
MPQAVRAIYRIPADEGCPAQARAIVDQELSARVPRPTLEELELLVSEIVTGAVPPGEPDDDAAVILDLRIDSQIRCAVTAAGPVDGNGGGDGGGQPQGLRGWSLATVAGLAERWGVIRARGGPMQVWFETPIRE